MEPIHPLGALLCDLTLVIIPAYLGYRFGKKKKKLEKLIASSSRKNNKKEGRHSSQD